MNRMPTEVDVQDAEPSAPRLNSPILRRVLGSAGIYAASVGLLAVAEMLLAHIVSVADFGLYQLVRQLVPLVAAFAAFGVDQSLPRVVPRLSGQPRGIQSLATGGALSGLVVGLLSALILRHFVDLRWIDVFVIVLAPPLLVASNVAAGLFRGLRSYARAAALQQGYRILLAIGLVGVVAAAGADSGSILPALLVVGAGVPAFLAARALRRVEDSAEAGQDGNRLSIRVLAPAGLAITVSTLTLGGMDWIDQAVLAAISGVDASGIYVAAKLYISFPFIAAASVLGFVALPEAARRPASVQGKAAVKAQLLLALLAMAVGGTTLWALTAIEGLLPVAVSNRSMALLAVAGAFRLSLVLPSARLGAFASHFKLAIFAAMCVVLLGLEGILVLLFAGDDPVEGAALAVAVTAALRFSVAWLMSLRVGAP